MLCAFAVNEMERCKPVFCRNLNAFVYFAFIILMFNESNTGSHYNFMFKKLNKLYDRFENRYCNSCEVSVAIWVTYVTNSVTL